MFKLLRNFFVLALMIAPGVTFAQDKNQNGGDSDEIEFLVITKKLNRWFQSEQNLARYKQSLNNSNVETTVKTEVIQTALEAATYVLSVSFTDREVRLPINKHGTTQGPNFLNRVCVNSSKLEGMICNRQAWQSTAENNKYLLVFHEIMGAIGAEKNLGHDLSVYDFTLALSEFIGEIKGEVITSDVILKCENSKYSLQITHENKTEIKYTLLHSNHVVNSDKVTFKVLDLTNSENAQPRAYLQIEHSGFMDKKVILQCNP